MEFIFALIVLLILAVIAAGVLVAPILSVVALIRTRSLNDLRDRIKDLERELIRRHHAEAPASIEAELPGADREIVPEVEAVDELLVPTPRRHRPWETTSVEETIKIESFIGRRVLAWVAAALLILAASFFLNYAFQSKMIGPAGQIAIGAAIGLTLCVGGFQRFVCDRWVTCRVLTATGVIVLFLSIFASFSIYRLTTPPAAGVYFTILIAQAAALAALYRSPSLAFLSIAGGLLTPLLIRTQGDPYHTYFGYLLALNVVVQALYHWRPWPGMRSLALLGTQFLFWLWFADRYHPEKAATVVAFHLALAAVYLTPDWAAAVRRLSLPEDWVIGMILPWFVFLALRRVWGEYHPAWMGTLSLAIAGIYTLFVVAASRRFFFPDTIRTMLFMATALAFLGLSFPIQAKSYWATAAWAAEGAALWWLGLRIRAWGPRAAGAVFLVAAFFCSLYVMVVHAPETPYWPVVNKRTLAVLAAAGGLFAAALAARRFAERLEIPDTVVRYAAGLVGIGLVWLVLSLEVWDGIGLLLYSTDELIMHTGLSFAWALYAGLLLAIGFYLSHAPTRWTALGLFSITLLKLLFYDLSELAGVYRVLTFLMAALVIAGAAWAYRRIQLAQNTNHEVRP